jgi:hypothetical protein
MSASTTRVPFRLRANDVVRHIINVDSRFRDPVRDSAASDFYLTLLSPVRNVLRIAVTSIEFPNNYPFFTAARRNVTLRVWYRTGASEARYADLVIPTGNYTAGDMVDGLNAAAAAAQTAGALPAGMNLTATFSEITGHFTFTATRYFGLDTTAGSFNRRFDYGLGYYLGLTRGLHRSAATAPFTVESDWCASFQGDNYLLLQVNDFACVTQTVATNDSTWTPEGRNREELVALAKIVIREPKNYMTFDDYAGQHVKEVVFPSPVDLSRLRVRVLDPYGEVVDMCSAQFSFSLEVLEIRNPLVYNAVRDSLAASVCGGALATEGGAVSADPLGGGGWGCRLTPEVAGGAYSVAPAGAVGCYPAEGGAGGLGVGGGMAGR